MFAENYETSRVGRLYLESVPRSHYEGKAVVPGYREPGWCGGPVSQLSVNSCRSLKEKSGQQGVR